MVHLNQSDSQPDPPKKRSAIEEAEAYGIDVSLLRVNLEMTPVQRWQQHQSAVNFVLTMQEARKKAL